MLLYRYLLRALLSWTHLSERLDAGLPHNVIITPDVILEKPFPAQDLTLLSGVCLYL